MSNNSYTPKDISSLLGVIDTYKRWVNYRDRDERVYEFYHPSEWGKCLRYQQYKHYAYLKLIDVSYTEYNSQILRLFDKGHNMHNRWVSYFDECNILRGRWECSNKSCFLFNEDGTLINNINKEKIVDIIKIGKTRIFGEKNPHGVFKPKQCICGCQEFKYQEVPVELEDINMKGHADVIIDCSRLLSGQFKGVRSIYNSDFLPANGRCVVGDMKTIGSRAWQYQIEKKGPHKHYIIQLICYIHILDCDYGVLMYENKDTSELAWFKVEKNKEWWSIIKWQAETMQNMVKNRKLPPPRPDKKDCYECKNCDFRTLCHNSKIWKDPQFHEKRNAFYQQII